MEDDKLWRDEESSKKSPWQAEENIEEALSEIVQICDKLHAANAAGYLQKTFRILNLITDIRANIVFVHQNKADRYQAHLEHLTADFALPDDCHHFYQANITETLTSIRKHIKELSEAAEIYKEIFDDDDSAYDTARVGDTVTAGFSL
jgi:hypothetical protein